MLWDIGKNKGSVCVKSFVYFFGFGYMYYYYYYYDIQHTVIDIYILELLPEDDSIWLGNRASE